MGRFPATKVRFTELKQPFIPTPLYLTLFQVFCVFIVVGTVLFGIGLQFSGIEATRRELIIYSVLGGLVPVLTIITIVDDNPLSRYLIPVTLICFGTLLQVILQSDYKYIVYPVAIMTLFTILLLFKHPNFIIYYKQARGEPVSDEEFSEWLEPPQLIINILEKINPIFAYLAEFAMIAFIIGILVIVALQKNYG